MLSHLSDLTVLVVLDCERIREELLGEQEDEEKRKWTILGQSFGGFVALTYLSFYPDGLKEVFMTAGLAPLVDHPDPVYHSLEGFQSHEKWKYPYLFFLQQRFTSEMRSITRNTRMMSKEYVSLSLQSYNIKVIYSKVRDILRHLDLYKILLPNGGSLSANRFLHLGLDFGMHGECVIIDVLLASFSFTPRAFIGGIDRVHRKKSPLIYIYMSV
jgi:pimeloyl-ACP methyl ester carboxylesterase